MSALLEGIDGNLGDRDADLVHRHQEGDASAFTELYERHHPALVRFCRRLVRDSHVAEEIAQEAFVRAYCSIDRLHGSRRFYPWLTVIARRLVIDHYRSTARVHVTAEVDSGSSVPAEEIALGRSQASDVRAALTRVQARHRDVLRMRDWEELSYEEIAERIGSPVTTVPPLLHRARSALRREYIAMTGGDRLQALFAPTVLALRRLRDRVASAASFVPDASSLCAPMAGAVFGMSVLVAPLVGGAGEVPFVATSATNQTVASPSSGHSSVVAAHPSSPAPRTDAAHPRPTTQAPRTQDDIRVGPGRGVAGVAINDHEGNEHLRERGRDYPVFVDTGPAMIMWHPEKDLDKLQEVAGEEPSPLSGTP